ncbi:MAG TPA: amino acid adenylation domain-containing protein, partial [Blastocatellia bacterium]|nr:amino acid adenylation domain-containing protein [Blastocatellia bacterium]
MNTANLVETLRWRASRQSEKVAYTFLVDGEDRELQMTYGQLDRRARSIAALLNRHQASGQPVLLLYPSGLEYLAAFFGCLYAGAIAVPAYPPAATRSGGRPGGQLSRLYSVLKDARPRVVLTSEAIRSGAAALAGENPALKALTWIATDHQETDLAEEWQERAIAADSPAFLQYTSGSTSSPKGVIVTHGNLAHNEEMIRVAMEHTELSTFVGWLPLYHDMGLIGNVLQPLHLGAACVLMSPEAFLQRPFRWLRAISRYRAATSGGPNFAYELCARKVRPEERATLDLSCWTVAFNGAEPVRAESLERFAHAFGACGFRREAFYPCYGLAEATLLVTGARRREPPLILGLQRESLGRNLAVPGESDVQRLVSCGRSYGDQRVAIVDPSSRTELPSGRIGEIWIGGPSIAAGYWSRPEETAATFGAHLAETGEGPFLRTGDLGFLIDGELFVTGRIKDLIIIRGRNHYPQDIELTVERSYEGLRPGRGIAFSVEAGEQEGLAVIQEIDPGQDRQAGAMMERIREAIAAEHEIQVSAIALVRPGSVPKTSSGKLQRRACREAYLNRQLDPIAEWRSESEERFDPASAPAPPRTLAEVEAWLQSKVAAGLKVDRSRIDPARPLAALGVDSLVTVELMHQLETELGVGVSIADLFESRSLSGLASRICSELAPAVVAVDRAPSVISTHPLSYGQRSLFFLHRLDPADPAYNLARAMRIVGDLDPDLLRRAFHLIVERQAALRTTFTVDSGEPVQQIHAYLEPHFRRRDASSWDESRMRAELLEEANRPFDLATGPLLRLELFTSSSRGPVLLLVMHHIISDLWSFAVLIDELRAVCEALGAGRPPALRPLTLQYPDYARQQADLMAGPEGERLWNHWRRQLAGGSPALNLPVDRPRALAGESRGAVQSLRIEEPLTQALRRLSQQENVTLYMTLLAVFQGLLHRYTGQDDLLIGSPTAGRHRAEFRDLIGYFVNPVVMRADLSGDPTFKQLLDRVRRNVLETFAHQEYPFALLVERLQPDRAHRGSPLLQVMFVLQKAPSFADENLASLAIGAAGGRIRLGASRLEAIPLDQEAALFDLTLTAAEVEGGLSFSLQYRTGLFDASTIERMLAHFNALLAAVAADRESPVSAWPLPIPAGAESRPPEVEDEVAPSEFSPGLCLPQLFEAQVRLRPNQAAVSFEGEQLTYDELNRRANRLAHYLRGRGVGPEVLVGLFVERSFDLVVGILGILKAGGAYVPLDPSYSPERVALMLEDAGVALLLTEDRMRERLPELSSPVVFLDLDRRALSEQQDEDPAVLTGPAHLAYVIYTSGSTGRPKGTEVTHANVTRLFTATRAWFQFDERDVWTLFHSCAFDFSVWELWGALLHGGRLVVVSHWVSRSPEAFLELLAWESVTVLNQTPSAFRQLIYACESSAGSVDLKLRLVIFGGEALDLDGLRPWFDRYGDRHPQLVNMYGITETTVHVTYRALKREDLDRPGGSRIGRPIPDLQLHLLDSRMRPVPIGVIGEIYVGGAGVARGYLGRPELTAERFLHDPFTGLAESRLYRTGDLARRRPDGDLEYVGRGDEQVKIRGFRIELQEIRSTILQHPRVRDAVITVVEDSPGERRLAAYLVPQRREEPPAIDELRRYLRERLAEFMVPSFFVMLDELPLTPHGKLDRRALPPPESNRPDLTSGFSAPETETEAALAEVWARALGIERVGIDDNFFDLGGDSIRSIQVKARAEQLGLNFSLQQMFGHPTIRRLALAIAGAAPTVVPAAVTQPFSLVSARDRERLPDGLDDSYPLTKLQAGLVFHSERAVDYETYVTSLHLRMPLEMPLLQRAIDRMVSRHPILRTSFNLSSYSEPLQLVHQAASLRLKFEDLSGLSDREQESAVAEFVAAERRRRFDWTRAPLIDLQVHRRSPETLQFTLSEPFLDGWSVASLLTELFTLYFSELTGGALSEREGAPLRAGFRDYVALEQEALRSSADREYWLNRMGDYSRRSLPQGPPLSLRAVALPIERLEVPISAPVSSAIYGFAHRARVPIKSVLLAAHLRVLSLLTGEPEVVTGLLYNGRPEVVDGDRMLGLFLNAMPMRLSLDPGTWAGLARAAFEAEQEAMPHRRYPLAELQRQGGGRPLFDAAFNFTHFHVYQNLRRIGGLEVLGGFASDQTFFDLTAQF